MTSIIEYLSDNDVDEALDAEIRNLLTTCFTQPHDVVFETQRYFREPYLHRWVIHDEGGVIIAHVGVHEKSVEANGTIFQIGGIAEVCVHPDYRKRGYVKMMLLRIHDWLREHGFIFSVLFGESYVYHSSGYVTVENLVHGGVEEGWKQINGMIKELAEVTWPTEQVRLSGPSF